MKKSILLFLLAAMAIAGCTKNTTNTTVIAPLPAFTVNGLHDITIQNGTATSFYLPLTVQYSDSAQETVTLSLSALPSGITLDTAAWVTSGIPTYTSELFFEDTIAGGVAPGTYPITLSAVGSATGKKTYTFNLKILPAQSCTSLIVGGYHSGSSTCFGFFTDSVYNDASVVNKIWFTNFNSSGNKIYALYNCNTGQLTIPSQLGGSIIYSGSGSAFGSTSGHFINLNIMAGSSTCSLSLN